MISLFRSHPGAIRGCPKRSMPGRILRLESLESRRLLASGQSVAVGEPTGSVHFRFDYSHDTGFFKNHPERRALLEQAGRLITDRMSDTLDAIAASNSAIRWEAHYTNPATGTNTKLPTGFSVAANEIVVFAGSRNLHSLDFPGGGKVRAYADGVNTPFSYSCPATTQAQCTAFGKTLTTRGEGVTQGAGAVDFAPFVASLSFDNRSDTLEDWNFDDGPLRSNQFRFLTFAQHELAHVLGFGISNSFITTAKAGKFVGPKTDTAYVGAGHLPLNGGHIAQSVAAEQATIMTSNIQSTGLLGPVDFAILDDIGWQVAGDPRRAITIATSTNALPENAGAFEVTATLSSASSVPINVPISIRGTATLGTDVNLSTAQFVFAANQKTATISVNIIDDQVYEAAESLTISLLDGVHTRLGSKTDIRLTIFDDDGFDLAQVRRDEQPTVAGSLTIPGDSQPHGIVFRAGTSQTLSVIATGVDQLAAGVLLYDHNQEIIGNYEATGLAATELKQGDSYALVFYPRTTSQTFAVSLPGGFNASPLRHNVLFPEDVNGSYRVTELDALQIINQLNQAERDFSVDAATVSGDGFYDVNGDGLITAVDALHVINYLNDHEPGGEPLADSEITPPSPHSTLATVQSKRIDMRDVNAPVQAMEHIARLIGFQPQGEATVSAAVMRTADVDLIFATDDDFNPAAIDQDLLHPEGNESLSDSRRASTI